MFIIYGYFVISKSVEMESCSQKSLYKDPFTAVNFILGVLDTVSCVVLPRACTNRHGSSLSLSLVTFCFCDMPSVWQTIPGVKSLRGNIASSLLSSCSLCLTYVCAASAWGLWRRVVGGKEALSLFFFFFQAALLALQVHWAMWLPVSFTRLIWVFPRLP